VASHDIQDIHDRFAALTEKVGALRRFL